MQGYLLGAFALSFLLLCLDVVGFLPLPGWMETLTRWVAGLSLVVGMLIFGPRFIQRIFGR